MYINSMQRQRNASVRVLIQIEEIKELRIPFIILSTKDNMLLLTGEVKYKGCLGR